MEHRYFKGFLSDNTASVHPAVMQALIDANNGHAEAYGCDFYTQKMHEAFNRTFDRKVYTFPVFNGTGANVSALCHMTKRYSAVLCSDVAHIYDDECGAPEHLTGCKLIGLPNKHGKIFLQDILPHLSVLGSQHSCQPSVLSLTQLTERGTAYTLEELRTLCEVAHQYGLYVHMDGARLANAIASLGCTVAEMTCDIGVDALSFGGTKNGMMFGEAVVFFDPSLAETFPFTRKNCTQLFSKSRYIAAQFIALLQDDLWLKTAKHANQMARRMAEGLQSLDGVNVLEPVDGNELFVSIPEDLCHKLNSHYPFAAHGDYRLVTSFDTTEEEVDGFLRLAGERL